MGNPPAFADNLRGRIGDVMKIVTSSVKETMAVGSILGRVSPNGTVVALHGNLGAGKTQLTRGIAIGAGVADIELVSSPTYVLLNVYPAGTGGKTVYHLDAYRVLGIEDFAAVGFEELVQEHEGIVVVEWAERIAAILPQDFLNVFIEAGEGEQQRELAFVGTGKQSNDVAQQVIAKWAGRTGEK